MFLISLSSEIIKIKFCQNNYKFINTIFYWMLLIFKIFSKLSWRKVFKNYIAYNKYCFFPITKYQHFKQLISVRPMGLPPFNRIQYILWSVIHLYALCITVVIPLYVDRNIKMKINELKRMIFEDNVYWHF